MPEEDGFSTGVGAVVRAYTWLMLDARLVLLLLGALLGYKDFDDLPD